MADNSSENSKNSYFYPIRSVLRANIEEKSNNSDNLSTNLTASPPPPPNLPQSTSTSSSTTTIEPPTPSSALSLNWDELNKPTFPLSHADLGLVHLPPLTPAALLAQPSQPQEDDYFAPKIVEPTDDSMNQEPEITVDDEERFVSFRYQATQDEHGNHVVVGREGKLERCEDEPIRTPGAVQAFGVLIAVQQTDEALVVRQVSENSTQLLGLSPRYLFSLRCFTDTLPESQADLLWDNILFLSETSPNPKYAIEDDAGAENPHIFLLSGYSSPGEDGGSSSDEDKAMWKCWCAIHRPPCSDLPDAPPDSQNLVILEFEFEKDTVNPLYPPPPSKLPGNRASTTASSASPPSFGSSVSGDSGTDSSMPSVPSLSLSSQSVVSDQQQGLEGDENWLPSSEDILASTTSHAKPVPALERLRRMNENAFPSSDSDRSLPSPSSPARFRSMRRAQRRRGNMGSRGGRQADGIGIGMMDIFAVVTQINEQFGAVDSLEEFLNVVVGILKDLTQFHRVLVYRFDEEWNGQVMAELVDWSWTRDLYRGLHFPASDIPAQARALYAINKVRLLYDRSQSTARIVARTKADLEVPLNMTHCYLRAMSPIHIKYLANMGIRASMSISIMAFGQLWGLISCHSYGTHGMRVSFPVRQMLRLISQSVSRNVERLSYAQRLHTRKLVSSFVNDHQPTGYIVSNADDLLGLFDADFGILVIGEGAKILGDQEPTDSGQEILIMAEYLRIKQFKTIQASDSVSRDFPDLHLTAQFKVVAGVLVVPLSSQGKDFIAFLRKGQPTQVKWAGRPYKTPVGSSAATSTWMRPSDGSKDTPTATASATPYPSTSDIQLAKNTETSDVVDISAGEEKRRTKHLAPAENSILEPRKSFKIWSETVAGKCRAWTDEHLETAGVLALVYGKFIEVWRQKENAMQTTKLTNLLLSNASHEVRTPLNHIINYLEMALNGPLDSEARENLSRSHEASKSLLFTINDLLDLTRVESGNETIFNEPFDLKEALEQATHVYRKEADRRDLNFKLELDESPRAVVGDARKIQAAVQNLIANAFKYTEHGTVAVRCRTLTDPDKTKPNQVATEIIVEDEGCGIPSEKLDSIFREFEQVERLDANLRKNEKTDGGVGLGLAVVARVVSLLGGQLRVESKVGQGTRVSFLIPLSLSESKAGSGRSSSASSIRLRKRNSDSSVIEEIGNLVDVFKKGNLVGTNSPSASKPTTPSEPSPVQAKRPKPEIPAAVEPSPRASQPHPETSGPPVTSAPAPQATPLAKPVSPKASHARPRQPVVAKMRILIVEDNDINRNILAKRLTLDGHTVVNTINGQECVDVCKGDTDFDIILMDLQMPILDGYNASKQLRLLEQQASPKLSPRTSHGLNNNRIPIFAVSASLPESQRLKLIDCGMDGWIVKPIDFRRLRDLLNGVMDQSQRTGHIYHSGYNWEVGGWLSN